MITIYYSTPLISRLFKTIRISDRDQVIRELLDDGFTIVGES